MPGRGNRRRTLHLYRRVIRLSPSAEGAQPRSPSSPSLKPPTGSRGGLRGSNLSRSPGPPPPPGLVLPSRGGWARGWGARRVGARSGSREGARTRSWLWRGQAQRSLHRILPCERRQQKSRGGATPAAAGGGALRPVSLPVVRTRWREGRGTAPGGGHPVARGKPSSGFGAPPN